MTTMQERFWSKVDILENAFACWLWTAAKNDRGYGRFRINHTHVPAHRFAFEEANGKIPPGLQVDHLCRNTSCVNPRHLEAVTGAENIRRGLTGKINHRNKRKTHCPSGHAYDVTEKDGHRRCGECQRVNGRRHYWRSKGRVM